MELFECPVLLFTADVRDALEWFELTHHLRGGPGWLHWQRTALPGVGGVEDQPAKLMEALALIGREENALIRQTDKRRASGQGNQSGTRSRRG